MPHISTEDLCFAVRYVIDKFIECDTHSKKTAPPINPIVAGSMAQLLNGVDFTANKMNNPADIDLAIDNMHSAVQVLESLKEDERCPFKITLDKMHSSIVARTFILTHKENKELTIPIQLCNTHDFGLIRSKPIVRDGIPVLSPLETLKAIEYRMMMQGPRKKDTFAYMTLLELHAEELLKDPDLRATKERVEFVEKFVKRAQRERESRAQSAVVMKGGLFDVKDEKRSSMDSFLTSEKKPVR